MIEEQLQNQQLKIQALKEKKELSARVIKAKIKKGGYEGMLLYIRQVFKEFYNREFEAYWYHELIIRVLWNVIDGKEKRVIIELGPRMGKTEIAVRQFISYAQGMISFIKNQYFISLLLFGLKSSL